MVAKHQSRMRAGAASLAAGIIAAMTVCLTAGAPPASAMQMISSRPAPAEWVARYNHRLIRVVNNRRVEHGLRRVDSTNCASDWAHNWSRYLNRSDKFEHSNLGGLLDKCHATYASENIALIYDGARPRDLVRAWMNSPGHRANILSGKPGLTGVSVRWDPSRNAWIAVQNFVRK